MGNISNREAGRRATIKTLCTNIRTDCDLFPQFPRHSHSLQAIIIYTSLSPGLSVSMIDQNDGIKHFVFNFCAYHTITTTILPDSLVAVASFAFKAIFAWHTRYTQAHSTKLNCFILFGKKTIVCLTFNIEMKLISPKHSYSSSIKRHSRYKQIPNSLYRRLNKPYTIYIHRSSFATLSRIYLGTDIINRNVPFFSFFL